MHNLEGSCLGKNHICINKVAALEERARNITKVALDLKRMVRMIVTSVAR